MLHKYFEQMELPLLKFSFHRQDGLIIDNQLFTTRRLPRGWYVTYPKG